MIFVRLNALLKGVDALMVSGSPVCEVEAVCDDSREVKAGSMFVAIKGMKSDGNHFISDVVDAGAISIVSEESLSEFKEKFSDIATIQVTDSRVALGVLARNFYCDPSATLTMCGITGTNGKTTVGYLVKAIFESAGNRSGIIGTIGYDIGSERLHPASHTTPSAVVLQRMLSQMVQEGVTHAVIEVTSHALALSRVSGCLFDTVVFTNLTRDHLDFHDSLESYFNSKLRLFSSEFLKTAVDQSSVRAIVNLDDSYGALVRDSCTVPVMSYGIYANADILARNVTITYEETAFTVKTPLSEFPVRSNLIGYHNVYNMLAAIGVGLSRGCSISSIQKGIASLKSVPGRFEKIDEGQSYGVVVDYAHTEDALRKLLSLARTLTKGSLITVFGCGGDRDKGKRSTMGRIAADLSDSIIVTSDNPRSEDPENIIRDVVDGIVASVQEPPYRTIPDRGEAIANAIHSACPDDLIVIAGKGHEDYQIIGNQRLDFDDRVIARNAIVGTHGSIYG